MTRSERSASSSTPAAGAGSSSERGLGTTSDERNRPSGRRTGRVLACGQWLFLAAGAALSAWWGLVSAEAYLAQQRAREALASATMIATPAHDRMWVGRGTALAKLSIPRLRLSAMVLQGTDARTLRRGLGHIETTALPGDSGNVAIAGHRDSFFRPLEKIQAGDDVLLETPRGHVHYRVQSIHVVRATDLSVLEPSARPTLTLVTCYPFWVLGHAPNRFVVRAVRVPDQTALSRTRG